MSSNTTTAVQEPLTLHEVASVATVLEAATTENGTPLVQMVDIAPVLLVFLRHAGCTFCREAVSDIAAVRHEIEATGTRIVLVHMGDREAMESVIHKYSLEGVDRICDESQQLYAAFGLTQGTWNQLYGFKVWFRGLVAGMVRGHGIGKPVADFTQMPGVFFLDRGIVTASFRHRSAADRPNYTDVVMNGLENEDRREVR